MFQNRQDAGRQLAASLKKYSNQQGIIMAVPRGGVPVAYEVAQELGWPIGLMLAKKLGHPLHKEYAVGAVGLSDRIIIPHADVSDVYIENETKRIRARLNEMQQKFAGNKQPENIQGKTVIIVDDGVATGNTILASVEILRKQQPAKIIVAIPVASQSAVEKLSEEADEVVVLDVPDVFYGVGQFYEDFTQVSDEEVVMDMQRIK
jgi:putative phosphoribosyl transferase